MKIGTIAILCSLLLCSASCTKTSTKPEVLKKLPIDGSEAVLTQTGVSYNKAVSSDGNGSLKITATQPDVFRLFEIKDLGIDDARLIYRAKLKVENVVGQVYLEMWCAFSGRGEYFSRGLQNPLSGTIDWTTAETPFFLQKGQKPELVKLNIVVNGTGTVWIDDIVLMKGPLK